MVNLLPELLEPCVELIRGNIKPMSMFAGLDASHAGAMCVGYHTPAADYGVLAHTTNGFAFASVPLSGHTSVIIAPVACQNRCGVGPACIHIRTARSSLTTSYVASSPTSRSTVAMSRIVMRPRRPASSPAAQVSRSPAPTSCSRAASAKRARKSVFGCAAGSDDNSQLSVIW